MSEIIKKETRNTKQRNLILECLTENCSKHLSIDELLYILKQKDEHIGIATVYRNLKLLEDSGCVKKVYISETVAPCYEIQDKKYEHAHHHLNCQKCGEIIDFEDDLLEAIEKIIEVTKNFTITNHRVIFEGICGKCKDVEHR